MTKSCKIQCKLYCSLIGELQGTSIALGCNLIQCSSSLVGYYPCCQPHSNLGIYSLHELQIPVMNSCFWYTLSLVIQQKPRAIPPSETVFHLSVSNLMHAIFPGDVCSSLSSWHDNSSRNTCPWCLYSSDFNIIRHMWNAGLTKFLVVILNKHLYTALDRYTHATTPWHYIT